jgi:hypothetical protein
MAGIDGAGPPRGGTPTDWENPMQQCGITLAKNTQAVTVVYPKRNLKVAATDGGYWVLVRRKSTQTNCPLSRAYSKPSASAG